MTLILDKEKINNIPMDLYFNQCEQDDRNHWHDKAGKHHYRLLSYISCQFGNKKITELGTRHGNSALAWGFNPTNEIHSYDIKEWKIDCKLPNVHFHIKNIIHDPSEILDSDIIFLDIDPHDGKQEKVFYDNLLKLNYEGIIICDDIVLPQYTGLVSWWNSIEEEKYDITEYGHFSGTGLINLSKENIVLR